MRVAGSIAGLVMVVCAQVGAGAAGQDDTRAELMRIERESHQQWLARDASSLDALMADGYRFVAMNGAVETKDEILGRGGAGPGKPSPLRVETLAVEPAEVAVHGSGTAVVLSLMRIRATVGERQLPERMRVLSVYTRETAGGPWRLVARSITPILGPSQD